MITGTIIQTATFPPGSRIDDAGVVPVNPFEVCVPGVPEILVSYHPKVEVEKTCCSFGKWSCRVGNATIYDLTSMTNYLSKMALHLHYTYYQTNAKPYMGEGDL